MTSGTPRPRGRPRTLSAAEALLWAHLRDRGLEGWRFFRRTPSSPVGPAATFVCPDASVSIEIDADPDTDTGPLRFTSYEVLVATESVLQAILLALRTALARRRTN